MKERAIYAEHLAKSVIERISGSSADRVVGKTPEDLFFVGRLGPQEARRRASTTYEPSQIGVQLFLPRGSLSAASLSVSVSADFFVRVKPTYQEEREHFVSEFRRTYPDSNAKSLKEVEDYLRNDPGKPAAFKIAPAYQKIKLRGFQFKVKLSEVAAPGSTSGRKRLEGAEAELRSRLAELLAAVPDLYGDVRDAVELKDLATEEAWEGFLKRCSGVVKAQTWDVSFICEVREHKSGLLRASVYFINATEADKGRVDRINTIFNAKLGVKVEGADISPIELNYFSEDYKYERTEPALGKNCSVRLIGPNEIETVSAPTYRQYRLKTRSRGASPAFKGLSENPLPILRSIERDMEAELANWIEDFEARSSAGTLRGTAKEQFANEIAGFEREIERFRKGVEALSKYPDVMRAFKLMNEAFMNSSKGFQSWRLFQIVFIVSVIPDIARREHPEIMPLDEADAVDLIYFPTGGGKTESYMGAAAFAMFFDRIRGKKAGPTAIVKYPLRLLSLQQLQRAADIIAQCELIRRREPDISNSDGFSIGFFVGSANTPNSLIDETDGDDWDLAAKIAGMPEEERNDKYLVVDRCPFCGLQSVSVGVDEARRTLTHECKNPDCPEGALPLFIVDREIYRRLPALIVSTLDKSALIGMQRSFRNILGRVSKKCPAHGYTSLLECTERETCAISPSEFEDAPIYDPAPSLVIQDELHLVRESLGAFNAHYETFINYFLKELTAGGKPIKVIAATATIADYEQQIYHLYRKPPRMFPSPSPYLHKSFYALTDFDDLNRIIVGVAPYGKTPIYSVQDIIEYWREETYKYLRNPLLMREVPGLENVSEEEAQKIAKDYWVILVYNQEKGEGMQVVQAVNTMINENLKIKGVPEIRPASMTGDDTFKDIRKILAEVERPASGLPAVDLISATSMISHGVDADAFNFMIFDGVPKSTAEYIQAYSRSGRKHPAVIFMIFNSNREKDKSYNQHFVKFNEYKDILVEPVPINRWANNAVYKTLPGLFCALVLQLYDYDVHRARGIKTYMLSGFQEAAKGGLIPEAREIGKTLVKAYAAEGHELGAAYEAEIPELVERIYERLMRLDCSPGNDCYLTEAMKRIGFPVMRSLRDTDVPVQIIMREPYAELARKLNA